MANRCETFLEYCVKTRAVISILYSDTGACVFAFDDVCYLVLCGAIWCFLSCCYFVIFYSLFYLSAFVDDRLNPTNQWLCLSCVYSSTSRDKSGE